MDPRTQFCHNPDRPARGQVGQGNIRVHGRTGATLQAGMFLVGCAYNFRWEHESVRPASPVRSGVEWQEMTPAMSAGLTDHRWTMRELLSYWIPLSPWVTPKRRRRQPKPRQPVAT
jgi:hypothetical protein